MLHTSILTSTKSWSSGFAQNAPGVVKERLNQIFRNHCIYKDNLKDK